VQPATRSSRFFCVYGAIGNPEKATFLSRRGAKLSGPARRRMACMDSRAAEGFWRRGSLFGKACWDVQFFGRHGL